MTSLYALQRKVCKHFGIDRNHLLSRLKDPGRVYMRSICMYLAYVDLKMSYTQVGVGFERDHTVIVDAVKRIRRRLESDPATVADIAAIRGEEGTTNKPSDDLYPYVTLTAHQEQKIVDMVLTRLGKRLSGVA